MGKELTKEELWEQQKARDLSFIERELPFIPEPSYRFNIGDKVVCGRLRDVTVEEILHDGRVYVLRCTRENNNIGQPKDLEVCHVCSWLDVRPFIKGETEFTKNEDVRLHFNSSTIEGLLHMAYHFGVDFDPEYQRGLVWTDEDKEKLLWSVFNNVDIGKFAFIRLDNDEWLERNFSYEILDGKQRLTTLMAFYENKLPYKGVYYNDLSAKDRNTFLQHSTEYAEIRDADRETRLKYFLMLNRGGRPMDEKHLEKVEQMLYRTENHLEEIDLQIDTCDILRRVAQEIVEALENCSFDNVQDSSGFYTIQEFADGTDRKVDIYKSTNGGNPHYVVYCSYEDEDFDYVYTDDLSVESLFKVLEDLQKVEEIER